jgi:adenylate kinase
MSRVGCEPGLCGYDRGFMRVVLLGAPGAGKGTQGAVVAERLGVPYVSTGERLRAEVARATDLGRKVAPLLDQGELVPDDLVLTALDDWLGSDRGVDGWVLDGFPRTVGQAERARGLVEPDVVVYLDIPDDEARRRLAERAPGGRRDDADPEVIDRRLRVFHRETEPLLDYYRGRGLLRLIDATAPPDEVTAAVLDALVAATS